MQPVGTVDTTEVIEDTLRHENKIATNKKHENKSEILWSKKQNRSGKKVGRKKRSVEKQLVDFFRSKILLVKFFFSIDFFLTDFFSIDFFCQIFFDRNFS